MVKFLALFSFLSPTRWMILGGILLTLVLAQVGFYFWAHSAGVDDEKAAQAKVEAIRAKDLVGMTKQRDDNKATAAIISIQLAQTQEKLNATDYEKSKALLAARDARRKLADGLRDKGSVAVPGVPDVGTIADDRSDLLTIASGAIGTANKNADIANGALAATEVDCKLYQKTLGKDVKKCDYGGASERYAARVKEVQSRAASLNDRTK